MMHGWARLDSLDKNFTVPLPCAFLKALTNQPINLFYMDFRETSEFPHSVLSIFTNKVM